MCLRKRELRIEGPPHHVMTSVHEDVIAGPISDMESIDVSESECHRDATERPDPQPRNVGLPEKTMG